VHHQSKNYNLSVALRQVSTEPILGFVFYLPLALIGLPPQQLLLTVLVVLFYQFWIHTEHIPKLGWFDTVFNSPANHRVHHATNPQYIDKNYGGFLMLWDRMFGTYEPEVEACVYGTKKTFESVDPVWTILSEYVSIYQSVKQVSDTLLAPNGQAFRQAVMVRYPHQGSWSIAFLTGAPTGEVAANLQGDYVSVYIPTTPNPTSGFFLLMPRSEVIPLNMSVDTALKYIVSMGVVAPSH